MPCGVRGHKTFSVHAGSKSRIGKCFNRMRTLNAVIKKTCMSNEYEYRSQLRMHEKMANLADQNDKRAVRFF